MNVRRNEEVKIKITSKIMIKNATPTASVLGRHAARTVLKKKVGNEIPSPGLAATLSPSDGERDGVRGVSHRGSFRHSFLGTL